MNEDTVETRRVLAVSREITLLHPLLSLAESNCWQVETAVSGWEAMERIQSDVAPHLLLLDLPRGDGDSLHTLRWLRRLRPDLPVVVTCHREDSQRQKEAIRLGAETVLIRPFTENHLESVIRQHLGSPMASEEVDFVSDDIESLGENEFFLGVSPAMQKVRAQAELLAEADVPVLIVGEPGSGKATVARLIHKLSVQSGFSFQRVDCAAMPGELLEIELFGRTNGHPHGPENGTRRNGFGKFELGGKGTLLLEDITEMPLAVQSRVFQVLQNKQFFRAGDDTPVGVDVRILATTSDKLDRALSEKRLREDLYYRLSAFTVHVPPLRHRREEIKFLVQCSMHKLAHHYGLPTREFTPSVLDACVNYSWPGNLEELETFVKRYLVAGDKEINLNARESKPGNHNGGGSAESLHLPKEADSESDDGGDTGPKSLKSLIKSVKSEAERNAIALALEKTAWNRKAAARLLKVSYRTLLYKIEQYHMSESASYVSSLPGNRLAGPKAS
jgi:two-component system, NtrC family, response regulator AtoC